MSSFVKLPEVSQSKAGRFGWEVGKTDEAENLRLSSTRAKIVPEMRISSRMGPEPDGDKRHPVI